MKYKVLVDGRFGEGYKAGDIVDFDENSARVPLEEGAIEISEKKSVKELPPEVDILDVKKDGTIACEVCNKEVKSKAGLKAHLRVHTKK